MAQPSLPAGVRPLVLASSLWALGIGLVLPLTLIYLHTVRHIPLRTTGVLLAIPGVIALVAIPVAGTLVDRVGARWVFAVTLGLIAVAQALLAVARTSATAGVALLIMGLAEGPAFPSFNTLLAERAPDPARQRAFGLNFTLFNAAIGVGALLGAAFANIHDPPTFEAMFAGSAAGALAAGVLVAVLPGPAVVGGAHTVGAGVAGGDGTGEGDGAPEATAPASGYRQVLADPLRRRAFWLALGLAMCGYGALESGLPAYANVVAKLPVRTVA
ncbi:MAG TPA: MFS transporter, partial [Acidimicrobiales bacterium]|nr:MFS transporter [Acidimicrobiales bacterium]